MPFKIYAAHFLQFLTFCLSSYYTTTLTFFILTYFKIVFSISTQQKSPVTSSYFVCKNIMQKLWTQFDYFPS